MSHRVTEQLAALTKEANLDYERTMNKINFDRIVASKPETFSYVTLPDKVEEKVPERGMDLSGGSCIDCYPLGLILIFQVLPAALGSE